MAVHRREGVLERPGVKLLHHSEHQAALAAGSNPFALVMRARVTALVRCCDSVARLGHKIRRTRVFYQRGWTREDILSLLYRHRLGPDAT